MARISTHTNIHNATRIQANAKNGVRGALRLTFDTHECRDGYAEYVIFLDDQALANRLAKSINEIMAARTAELKEPETEDEPANEYVRDDGQFGVGA